MKKILLFCGILSSLQYVAMNIFVPLRYPGYDVASQTVSELSAIGAPTRPLWTLLSIFYSVFVIAFAYGLWRSAARNHPLRIVAGLMYAYGVLGFFWPPMHQRVALGVGEGTMTDTMHIAFSVATVLLMVIAILIGAALFGKLFRLYSILTLLLLLLFGALTGWAAPRLQANLPTPWLGVWERISIGVFLLWVIVLAIVLLRRQKEPTIVNHKHARQMPLSV